MHLRVGDKSEECCFCSLFLVYRTATGDLNGYIRGKVSKEGPLENCDNPQAFNYRLSGKVKDSTKQDPLDQNQATNVNEFTVHNEAPLREDIQRWAEHGR